MSKISFVFTKEMAENLKKIREKAHLSQTEVANRIGLTYKTADSFISHLEKGRIKNPSLGAILLYLRACGSSWPEFFKQLDAIDFRTRHERMLSQLPRPPGQRKIQRDAMRYEIGIEFPSKEKPKRDIDFDRLKSRIENKVTPFLIKNDIEGNQVLLHKKFVREYFDFMAALNKPAMKATTDKYLRTGLKFNIIHGLRKIIVNEIRAELKRIEARKPLPTGKQEKMAIGFTQYRIRIEKIEAEAHRLLCDMGVPTSWFSLYKDFVRECYRVYKKYFPKMFAEPLPKTGGATLEMTLNKIIEKWVKQGLKEDILLKLKDRMLSVFTAMRMKGLT